MIYKNRAVVILGTILLVVLLCFSCSIGIQIAESTTTPLQTTPLQSTMVPVTPVIAPVEDYRAYYNQIITSSNDIILELDKGYDANATTMTKHFAIIIGSYDKLIELKAPVSTTSVVKPCADTIHSILKGNIEQTEALKYYTVLSECATLELL